MNRTLYFGEGLFETIKWVGESKKLKLHYERISSSAKELGIPCPRYEEFLNYIKTACGGDKNLYVKFCLLSKGSEYYPDTPDDYEVRVVVKSLPPIPKSANLCLSTLRRHSKNPIFVHKTMNFLFNVMVKREARKKGFYDAVVLNEKGRVTECSASNIMALKGEKLITPSRSSGLLWGTTIEYLKRKGVPIKEKSLTFEELLSSDAVFITNSIMGVVPVKWIEDKEFSVDTELLKDLKELLYS